VASEVGSGQVAIFPTFRGFRKSVAAEVDGSAKSASSGFAKVFGKSGAVAGQTAGKGFKSAFTSSSAGAGDASEKALKASVASASKAFSTARLKEQDAAGKVRVAEAALNDVRSKGVAGSARVVAAEERLATATRGLDAAQDATRQSSLRLTESQSRLAATTVQGNEKVGRSARMVLTSSLKRGANLGASAGLDLGRGFLGSFKKAVAPIAGIAAGYLGLQALGRGFRAVTGFVRDSVSALGQWEVLNAQSFAAIKSTGGAARVTAGQVHELALSIEDQTATEAEAVQEGANLLLTFKNIRNEAGQNNNIFDQTTLAAVNMARALGTDTSSAAMQLGKALNDPEKGLTRLTRSGVTFTAQQREQVAAMVAAGDTLGAQKIILQEVNSEFGKSGEAYANTLPGQLVGLRDAYGDVGETISTGLTPAMSKFVGFATDSLNGLNSSGALSGFVAKLNTSGNTLTTKAQQIRDLFVTLSGSEQGFTTSGFLTGLGEIVPQLQPLLGVLTALQPVLPAFSLALGQIGPALAPVLPVLGQLVATILPVFATIISSVILPAVGFLAGALSKMGGALGPLAVGIAVASVAMKVFNAAMSANPIGLVITAIAAVVGALVYFFTQTKTGQKVWAGFTSFLTDAWKNISKVAVSVWTGISSFFSGLWSGIKKIFNGAVDGILNLFLNWTVYGIIISHWGEIVSFFSGVWSSIVDGVSGMIGNVVSFFSELKGKIFGALGNAGSWLVSVGRNIIQGLINGVSGMISNAVAAVKNVGGRMLEGIQNFLGIHSPSTVFKAVGGFIVSGLVSGITGAGGTVKRAVKNLLDVANYQEPATELYQALKSELADIDSLYKDKKISKSTRNKRKDTVRKAYRAVAANDKAVQGAANGFGAVVAGKDIAAVDKAMSTAIAKINKQFKKGLITRETRDNAVESIRGFGADAKAAAKQVAQDQAAAISSAGELINSAFVSWFDVPQLSAESKSLMDAVASMFGAGLISAKTANRLNSSIQSADKKLASIATSRSRLAEKLTDANSKLSAAISMRDDYKKTVADAVSAFGNITKSVESATRTVTKRVGDMLVTSTESVGGSAQGMIQNLKDSIAKTQAFGRTMKQLRDLGLDNTSIQQLQDEFNSSGSTAIADSLLAGGPAAVREVASLQGDLTKAGESLGAATSTALYQAGVNSAQGLVNGLMAQDAALEQAAKHISALLIAQVKSSLGIHSPSTVMAALGRFTGLGISTGLDDSASSVQRSIDSLSAIMGSMTVPSMSVVGRTSAMIPSPARVYDASSVASRERAPIEMNVFGVTDPRVVADLAAQMVVGKLRTA
jgi:phage-related protein